MGANRRCFRQLSNHKTTEERGFSPTSATPTRLAVQGGRQVLEPVRRVRVLGLLSQQVEREQTASLEAAEGRLGGPAGHGREGVPGALLEEEESLLHQRRGAPGVAGDRLRKERMR